MAIAERGIDAAEKFSASVLFEKASAVKGFSERTEKEIRGRLKTANDALNRLFGSSLHPSRVDQLDNVFFVTTSELVEILMDTRPFITQAPFFSKTSDIEDARKAAVNVMGLIFPSGDIIVSTTTCDEESGEVRQITPYEAEVLGSHEITHAKIQPRDVRWFWRYVKKTGCLRAIQEGRSRWVEHSHLDDAQTDLLAIFARHQDTSWDDQLARGEQDLAFLLSAQMRYGAFVTIVSRLLPNCSQAIPLIASWYIHSEDTAFKLSDFARQMGDREIERIIDMFSSASAKDNLLEMAHLGLAFRSRHNVLTGKNGRIK